MSKRKRSPDQDGDLNGVPDASTGSSTDKRRKLLVDSKYEKAQARLQSVLEVTSVNERHKITKRKKTAQKKNDSKALGRIESELAFLKAVDFNTAATVHLCKTLLKIPSIANSPFRPSALSTAPKAATSDSAGHNVLARLYSADMSSRTLSAGIEDVKKAFQADGSSDALEDISESDDDDAMSYDSEDGASEDDETSFNGFSDTEGDTTERDPTKNKVKPSKFLSGSPMSTPEPSPDIEEKPSKRPTESSFLPALTMGGYWSGSESEPESDPEIGRPQPRKNRRGQQERRKIWEQKFKNNAKHLQGQESKENQEKGRDGKQGDRKGRAERGPPKTGSNTQPIKKRERKPAQAWNGPQQAPQAEPEKPTHPSWEAAKKLREQKQKLAFTGKKVTFD